MPLDVSSSAEVVAGSASAAGRGVVFNGKFLNTPARGLSRVASELISAVDAILVEQPERASLRTWELACRRDAKPGPPLLRVRRRTDSMVNWDLWEQLELPRLARGKLLVNLCNMSPLAVKGAITVIHDAHVFMMPESHSRSYAAWYRFALPRAARDAARLVTVSEFSRQRLAEHGLRPAGEIEVIANGGEHMLRPIADPAILDRLGLRPGRFVLALANRQPHKNIGLLFEAFRDPRLAGHDLVLVGPHDRKDFLSHGLNPPAQARFAGHVTDGELRALYELALCFCTPSLMEGFGLPALEAMTLGCPVIAAPRAAALEVCAGAAMFAEPHDAAAWADAIAGLADDAGKRASLSRQGLMRSHDFSWRRGGERLLQLIEEVAPAPPA